MPKKPIWKFQDSGKRCNFTTGAQRDMQEGKGRMDLLPVRAIFEVAKVLETGAKKYSPRNWEKGIPLSRFLDSGLRHAMKYLRGDRDEPHDSMAAWNFLCLIETRMRIEEGLLPEGLNDLPWNPLEIQDNPLGIEITNILSSLQQSIKSRKISCTRKKNPRKKSSKKIQRKLQKKSRGK